MNRINLQRKCSKINDRVLYPPNHNGLVAGSSPPGPPIKLGAYSVLFGITAPETPRFVHVYHALAPARLMLHFVPD
jgi:hypothetical protein